MSQAQRATDRSGAYPHPIRVLAVEDVAVNRELMRLFLEERGFEVDVACDGVEAVGAVGAADYDLVFMDVQMPGLDGLDATRQIRAMGGRAASLPIVALSANMVPGDVQRCLDAGMTAHLGKPFSSDTLADAVRRWVLHGDQPANPTLDWLRRQTAPAQVRSLLKMFLGQIAALENSLDGLAEDRTRSAHALGGAAATLGYQDLTKLCRDLERSGGDDGPALEVALTQARTALASGRYQVETEIARCG